MAKSNNYIYTIKNANHAYFYFTLPYTELKITPQGLISGGVYSSEPNPVTVINHGAIAGNGAEKVGVSLAHDGSTVINGPAAYPRAYIGGGVTLSGVGTLNNWGTISG